MNAQDAAIEVLKKAKKPLRAEEIAARSIADGLWETTGKTPGRTVGAVIYHDIKANGERSPFVKVDSNIFYLRDFQGEQYASSSIEEESLFEHSPAHDHYSEKKTNNRLTFLDAAERVLDKFANRNAMHYQDITKKAIEKRWLNTKGKTPKATMNAILLTRLEISVQQPVQIGSLLEWIRHLLFISAGLVAPFWAVRTAKNVVFGSAPNATRLQTSVSWFVLTRLL